MDTITVFHMDADEFEDLVREKTGRVDYNFRADQEAQSCTSHFFQKVEAEPNYSQYLEGTKKELVDEWYMEDVEDVDEWIEGTSRGYMASNLFTWLAYHKHIEPGDYLITV